MTRDSAAAHSSPTDASPPRMAPETLPYAGNPLPDLPAEPGPLAPATLVFGLASMALPPLIPITWLCGIGAIISNVIRTDRREGRPHLYLGFLASLIACVMYMAFATVPPARRAHARRIACMSNLRQIAVGLSIYAVGNRDQFPVANHRRATQDGTGETDYTQAIGSYRSVDVSTLSPPPDVLSTTRNLWTIARKIGAQSSDSAFICPASGDVAGRSMNVRADSDFGSGTIIGAVTPAQARLFWTQVSYGYRVPYGKHTQPDPRRQSSAPLAADRGPFGAAIEGGRKAPGRLTWLRASSGPEDWQQFNSPNHGGDYQSVAFGDGHVEFKRQADAGVQRDNIYTRWSTNGATLLDRLRGTPPTLGGKQTPMSNTDTLIYP